jgi:hypothetical protein
VFGLVAQENACRGNPLSAMVLRRPEVVAATKHGRSRATKKIPIVVAGALRAQ